MITGILWENNRYTVYAEKKKKGCELIDETLGDSSRVSGGDEKNKEPLDLADTLIPHKPKIVRSRKGLKGISSLGKLITANAALRLQKEFSKENLDFTTLTLPELPLMVRELITAKHFEYLEKQLIQELKRNYDRKGIRFDLVGCVEIQEERYQRDGFPYPHWHFIHKAKKFKTPKGGTKNNPWCIEVTWLRSLWKRLVKGLVVTVLAGSATDCTKFEPPESHWIPSVEMQIVKKDASKYISKYISKGVECVQNMVEKKHEHLIPYQWWYATKELKERTLAARTKIHHNTARHLYMKRDSLIEAGVIKWYYVIYGFAGDKPMTIAVTGELTNKWANRTRNEAKQITTA